MEKTDKYPQLLFNANRVSELCGTNCTSGASEVHFTLCVRRRRAFIRNLGADSNPPIDIHCPAQNAITCDVLPGPAGGKRDRNSGGEQRSWQFKESTAIDYPTDASVYGHVLIQSRHEHQPVWTALSRRTTQWNQLARLEGLVRTE